MGVHNARVVVQGSTKECEAVSVLTATALARDQELGNVIISVELALLAAADIDLHPNITLALCAAQLAFLTTAHAARYIVNPLEELSAEPVDQLDEQQVPNIRLLFLALSQGNSLLNFCKFLGCPFSQLVHGNQRAASGEQKLVFVLHNCIRVQFQRLQKKVGGALKTNYLVRIQPKSMVMDVKMYLK